MDALMLDGNAVAGLLQEVFAVEMTTATVSCNACGRTEAVGAPRISRRGNRHAVPALRQRRGHDCGGRHTRMDGLRGRPHAASQRLTLRSRLFGKEVNTVEGFAGDFSLATHVEGHPAETLVHVSVSQRDAS
jgi:hypothetical protein